MTAVTSSSTSLAVWYTMRATGTVALLLLTATVVLGLLTAGRVRTPRWPAFAQAELHKRVSVLATAFVGVHVLTAVLDSYVKVGLLAAVLPFTSHYRPFWVGLGTAAVDLLAAVGITSALRGRIPARSWRLVHWTAYACWPLALAHGLGMGTDAATLWFDVLAGLSTATVAAALAWRIRDHRAHDVRARPLGATTRTPVHPTPVHLVRTPVTAGPIQEHRP